MIIDMSTKEMRAASAAFSVATEIAKERLGEGEYVNPGMLLQGLTEVQLREFVRICRELELYFDRKLISHPEGSVVVVKPIPPDAEREIREMRGGYGEE